MKYTDSKMLQEFLDNKYGQNKCYVFNTTGVLPSGPNWLSSAYKITDTGHCGIIYWGGVGPSVCAIDMYHDIDVDISEFNYFIEPPINIRIFNSCETSIHSSIFNFLQRNGLYGNFKRILEYTTEWGGIVR